MNNFNWSLGEGNSLEFFSHDLNTNWASVPGLYIFAYTDGLWWHPLYIGQADDLSMRLPYHERRAEAIRRGATHIHAAHVPSSFNRDIFERLLIQTHKPPMNDHHKQ
jgi:hypothetical protein